MIKMGVYVNDLNLHDSSRELILAGTQQSAELQLALDQVKENLNPEYNTKVMTFVQQRELLVKLIYKMMDQEGS